jgi:hypothetical protein
LVVDVDEPGQVVALAIDGAEVLDNQVVHGATSTSVLVSDGDREDFEPDALEIHPRDVLPCGDGHGRTVIVLDQHEHATLEPRSGYVADPRSSVDANPLLDLVLEWPTRRASELGQASSVSGNRIELAKDH